MGDIAIVWEPGASRGDWAMCRGDLQSGSDLETAILLSLFTDRRNDTYVPPPPTANLGRRGCWTDSYTGYQIGSWLWTRTRLIKTQATLLLIVGDCRDALAWMIVAGVVAAFDIDAAWVNRTGLALAVTAHMPDGRSLTFNYRRLWGD